MSYVGNKPTSTPITSSDLNDGIVTNAKLANDSVDGNKLATGSVDLASGDVTGILPVAKLDTKAWSVKTTTYTAASGDRIQANTTGGAWTLTLPATPVSKDVVEVADYAGTFATNNLTIGRNGTNIMGLSEDMVISSNNVSITLEYVDATQGWRVL